jgi:hypothetical protein
VTFDWPRFLTSQRIEWTDRGHSATKNNIAIACPWCGSADPSQHLAISLEGRGYRCFRSPRQHSGRSIPRLIAALLGCSWSEALRLAGISGSAWHLGQEDGLSATLTALTTTSDETATDHKPIGFPVEFRPLTENGAGRYFTDYLIENRNYAEEDIRLLAKTYNLHYAIAGAFKWRVIFPVIMNGQLVNWTGRSISPNENLRYRTLSANPEKAKESRLPVAPRSIEKTLWNFDNLMRGGRELLICEGPFDAMRLDFLGATEGIRATCTWTKAVSDYQLDLLDELRGRFDHMTRVLDNDAQLDILAEIDRMAHLRCRTRKLPNGVKDPGELSYQSALEFMEI